MLVAESYEGARIPCARYLRRFNFDVTEAASSEEAMMAMLAAPPRLILAEWNLASTLARFSLWLAPGWKTSDIPVIVIVNEFEPERNLPRVAGVLTKPFSLTAMLEEVRRVLREHDHLLPPPVPRTPRT